MTCGLSFSTILARASCFVPLLMPRMFIFIKTTSSSAGSCSSGTGLALISLCLLLPLIGGTYAVLLAALFDYCLDWFPLVWFKFFLCGENSAALTLKICCFLEVFFDLFPLSLDVSIMTNVSSFKLCSTATAIYFFSELFGSPRAGTLYGRVLHLFGHLDIAVWSFCLDINATFSLFV